MRKVAQWRQPGVLNVVDVSRVAGKTQLLFLVLLRCEGCGHREHSWCSGNDGSGTDSVFPREALEFPYDLSGDSFIFSFSRLQVFSALFVWYVPKYRDPARDISC